MFFLKNYSSIIAFVGILTFIIIPLYQITTPSEDYLDIVSKSFQGTKAEFCELNIEAWAQINKKGLSSQELYFIYDDLAKILSLTEKNRAVEHYSDFIGISHQEQVKENVYLQLSLQAFQSEGLESGTFLGIQVNSDDLEESREYVNLLEYIFESLNCKTQIGVTFVGYFSGKLEEKELYQKSALAFSTVNAQVLEGIHTKELLSLTGYSPICKNYLDVNGKKINLNVALRYHTVDNKTYIHIGAPLIFQEY